MKALVTAVEVNKDKARLVANLGVIPQERVIHGDGVRRLYKDAFSGKRYDLLTTFLLEDYNGKLIQDLIPAARAACAPQGKFIITSDCITMSSVYKEFINRSIAFTPITTCGDQNDPEHSGLITSFKRSNIRQRKPFF
jgi:hypothetical protein